MPLDRVGFRDWWYEDGCWYGLTALSDTRYVKSPVWGVGFSCQEYEDRFITEAAGSGFSSDTLSGSLPDWHTPYGSWRSSYGASLILTWKKASSVLLTQWGNKFSSCSRGMRSPLHSFSLRVQTVALQLLCKEHQLALHSHSVLVQEKIFRVSRFVFLNDWFQELQKINENN